MVLGKKADFTDEVDGGEEEVLAGPVGEVAANGVDAAIEDMEGLAFAPVQGEAEETAAAVEEGDARPAEEGLALLTAGGDGALGRGCLGVLLGFLLVAARLGLEDLDEGARIVGQRVGCGLTAGAERIVGGQMMLTLMLVKDVKAGWYGGLAAKGVAEDIAAGGGGRRASLLGRRGEA